MQVTPKVIDFSCIMITHMITQKIGMKAPIFEPGPFFGQKWVKMAYFEHFFQNRTFFGAPKNFSVFFGKNHLVYLQSIPLGTCANFFSPLGPLRPDLGSGVFKPPPPMGK